MRILAGIAALVIRLHPPAWKRRYGTEVLALVEDAPPGVWGVSGLFGSAFREWTVASWRSVVIAPTGVPHPGRLAGLSLMSVTTLYLATALVSWGYAVWWIGVALASGRPDAAMRVVDMQLQMYATFGIPNLQQAGAAAVGFFLWCIIPAFPVIVLARWLGLGQRFPLATRVAVTLAFAALFLWLTPPRAMAGALTAGWVFASGWFPRGRTGRPSVGDDAWRRAGAS